MTTTTKKTVVPVQTTASKIGKKMTKNQTQNQTKTPPPPPPPKPTLLTDEDLDFYNEEDVLKHFASRIEWLKSQNSKKAKAELEELEARRETALATVKALTVMELMEEIDFELISEDVLLLLRSAIASFLP